jgi:putative methanogenesis marker protein 6
MVDSALLDVYRWRGENVNITKYVITSPECTDILPSDIAAMVYESKYDVDIKETCFGVIINGEEDVVKSLVEEIRALDPPGIFVKNRGFPPGDPRRCRGATSCSPNKIVALTSGHRSGCVRPGSYMIEAESKMLPLISKALASQAKEESEYPEKSSYKVELIQSGASTTSQKHAREIMGKNFFGLEEAVKYFGINPTPQQLTALSKIPFSEAMLKQSKDTHILVAVLPLSILEIRDKVDRKLFYNHETAWYNEQPFAKAHDEVSWRLVRKVPVKDSIPKDYQEQQALFSKDDEAPTAQVVVYTIIGQFLNTGEWIIKQKYAYTSSIDSRGNCVYVTDVGLNGLGISDYWDAVFYDDEDIPSPRKL